MVDVNYHSIQSYHWGMADVNCYQMVDVQLPFEEDRCEQKARRRKGVGSATDVAGQVQKVTVVQQWASHYLTSEIPIIVPASIMTD
jgi:hypothetical protein